MDRRSTFSKTAKGLKEATGKTNFLSRDLRDLLNHVDGRTSIADLGLRLEDGADVEMLLEVMRSLEKDGFVRELPAPATGQRAAPAPAALAPPAAEGEDLDFTAIAAEPATPAPDEAAAQRKAAARSKVEAHKAQRESEARS